MTERRKFKRYPITYAIEGGRTSREKTLVLVDMSENGIAFTSSEKLQKNSELNLNIFLKKKRFNMKAVIIHASQQKKKDFYNVGARFLNIPEDFRKILTKEVEDIMQLCRESSPDRNKNFSFKKASAKYLKNFPIT